jgi:nucleotide-binding universal stress UspA family protein
MSFKSLLVHVRADGSSTQRVKAAVALARKLDALLIGLGAEAIPPALIDPYGMATADWLPMICEQQAKNLQDARVAFEIQAEGVRSAWLSSKEPPTIAMARQAREADLLIVGGTPVKADEYVAVNHGELVVTAGRPVLMVPSTGGVLSPRRVLIAWKDSRETRRAVADALPFLVQAESIVILALCGRGRLDETRRQAEDVAGWLRRHGAASALCQAAEAPADLVDAEILAKAEALRADLIVAGGYGHSRAAEWVLGGVTRTLLSHPLQFVFLSH